MKIGKWHIGFWYFFKWNESHPFIQDGEYTAATPPPKESYIGIILYTKEKDNE